jgi:hypothetical protein
MFGVMTQTLCFKTIKEEEPFEIELELTLGSVNSFFFIIFEKKL